MEEKLKIGRDYYDFVWEILQTDGADEMDALFKNFLELDAIEYFYYKYAKNAGKKVGTLNEYETAFVRENNWKKRNSIQEDYNNILNKILRFKYTLFHNIVFVKKEIPEKLEGVSVGLEVRRQEGGSTNIYWNSTSNAWSEKISDLKHGDKVFQRVNRDETLIGTYFYGDLYELDQRDITQTQKETAKVVFCKVLLILVDKYESGELVGKSKYALRKLVRDGGLGKNTIYCGVHKMTPTLLNLVIKVALDIISFRNKITKYRDLKFRGFIFIPNYVNKAKFATVKSFSMRLYFAYRLHLTAGKKIEGTGWAPFEGYLSSFNKKDKYEAVNDEYIVVSEGTRTEMARKRHFYEALKDFTSNIGANIVYGEVSKKITQIDDSVTEKEREVIWSRGTFKKQMERDMEPGISAVKVKIKYTITIIERYSGNKKI